MSSAYRCNLCGAYFDQQPIRLVELPLPFTYKTYDGMSGKTKVVPRILMLSVQHEGLDFCHACLLSFAGMAYEKFTKQLVPEGTPPDTTTDKPVRSHRRKETRP